MEDLIKFQKERILALEKENERLLTLINNAKNLLSEMKNEYEIEVKDVEILNNEQND